SNDQRYLNLTGPYTEWKWKDSAKIPMHVANTVEVYVGKFDDDFKKVERWVQVTHNKHGDYYPDTWIKPQTSVPTWYTAAPVEEPTADPADAKAKLDVTGQVFLWETGNSSNQIVDPRTGAIRQCTGKLRGEARFARNSVLDLAGGAFLPEATDEPLLKAAKGENAFALEAIVTPTAASSQPTPQSPTDSAGGGSILSYAPETTSPVTPNFVLGQSGNWLTLRLKTDGAAPAAGAAASPASPSALKLVPITPGQSYHIVVSYGKSGLACYINGKRALISGADGLTGGLGAWTPARLVFGDEWTGGRNWPGFLEGVGLFGREISAGEARARFQDQASKRIGRKPGVDRAVVQARLVAPCDPADPSAIAPYLRCLSVQQYEVVKVLEGKVADKKISVAQWSVLGGKVLPSYATYKQGDTYRLVLERWADRPELEGERLIAGNFTEEGDMYYQEREVLPVASASPDAAPSPLQITEADSTAGRDITIEAAKIPQLVVKGNVRLGGNTTAPGGRLSSVSVIDGGAGYVKAPIITITGGGGSGAKAEALLSVGSFDLPRVGTGYKTAPKVIVSEPDIAGGIQAVARAEIAPVGGTIVRVLVLHPGSGYTQAPVVKLEGGDGTGAQVRANMEVNSIFVTQGGSGYTTPPAIILKGDAAQDAIAMAALQTTTLQCTGTRSQFRMEVAGDLTQDGAALVSAWMPDLSQMSSASMDGRTFSVPTGSSWTLQNASTMRFLSPAGRTTPPAPATNAGRLRVLGDSRLGVQDLLTSGEVELGNGAVIGQPEYTANDATITNTGRFLVSGGTEKHPACFGLPSEQQMRYGKRTLINGDASGKAAFTLGDGKTPAAFRIMGADQINVLNGPQSAMDLNAGSVLSLTASTFGSQDRAAKVANAGLLTFAGKLIVQGNHTGFVGIENKGNLVLKGDGMIIERLPHANGPGGYFDFNNNPAQIVNTEGATITGSGRLRYINSTGSEQANSLRIRNMGVLQPTGTLTLENTNLHIGSPEKAGSLHILISGPAAKPGSCTSVHLLRGSGNLEPVALNHAKVNDNPGILSITPNVANTLRIRTATGVAPRGTYRILSAVQLTGTFAEVEYNGQQVIEGNPAAPFKISYQPDGLEVTFP
ncbi:MAG: LamG-like jellyroll fold domain-containing protein, partial [Candidatus Methylacidiphilales bacterium]